jgi:transcriptional regulator with XRE-family HTH domain
MKHEKLMLARKSRGFTQNQMAEKIAMEQTTYSRKEIGKSSITDAEWDKFAKVLDVAVEDIKDEKALTSIKNDNWSLNDNSIGIQYVNIPQNVFDIIIKYNNSLEKQNKTLEEENVRLKSQIVN